MVERNKTWFFPLGIFYVALVLLGVLFHQEIKRISFLHVDHVAENERVSAEFTGSDWVRWEEREGEGVFAAEVHPLLSSKRGQNLNEIGAGDRIINIEGREVMRAEVVEQMTKNFKPSHTFTVNLESPNTIGGYDDKRGVYITNGFKLSYSFNERGFYWNLSLWIISVGLFITLVIFVILIPLIRGQIRDNISLLGVVIGAFLLFGIQVSRNFYLFLEQDLSSNINSILSLEKFFFIAYPLCLSAFVISYFHFKLKVKIIVFTLPSIAFALYFLFQVYDIVFIDKQLKFFQEAIESHLYAFFFLQMLGATLISIMLNWGELRMAQWLVSISVAVFSLLGILYFLTLPDWRLPSYEDVLLASHLFLFFPLINGTFYQLQFGKVRVVLTQTVQYILFFLIVLVLYIFITQISDVVFADTTFKRELVYLSLFASILFVRWLYLGNQSRFSKFFITAQQEKEQLIKSFIAQIPRYTSSKNLRADLVNNLEDFFAAETVHLWWKGDQQERMNGEANREHEMQEQIYTELTENQTVWSKNKQIAPYKLGNTLEDQVLNSTYNLVSPITISEESYSLLMLGKKKRGVYNLSDLEIISQLVQQTQLTLNIIQLNTREKELIQAKYEADLMALRSQINPHFLFNTLNSLTELVHESPDLAEEAIEKLSYIFRYTTKQSHKNLMPFRQELELVTTYLDLEKIRFGNRLKTLIETEDDIMDVEIPAFVLQTFVENCIKHGIAKILYDGLVSIKAFRKGKFFVCEVFDNGPGIDLSRLYKSTGLSNTIKRFDNLYESKNLLDFENTGDGTLVRFRVPLMETVKIRTE